MDYSMLANYYEQLESISSKLAKTDILADLFKKTQGDELPKTVLLVQGIVFPRFAGNELGIAVQMMIKAISKTSGLNTETVEEIFRKTGDLGLTAEKAIKERKQSTLASKKLTVENVFSNLQKLAFITGQGSQEKKLSLIAELLSSASPKEARYISRTILEVLRVGVAEGIIRDAIVKAFLIKGVMEKEDKQKISDTVEYAYNIISDFGEVAKIARESGIEGLKKANVQLGKPIQVMLGEKAESIKEIIERFGRVAIEWKYDGMRAQIHKNGEKIWVYTRRMEDVTKQFPDLVDFCKNGLDAKECIVEGEVLGINLKSNYPLPFQFLSQRIHRKYDIHKMVKEIPIQFHIFDALYLDGKTLFHKKFIERRKILEKIVKQIPGKLQLSEQIVTSDIKESEKFYRGALKANQEGVFIKLLDSPYTFGRHVEGWYKIKPVMESLDLVVVGATWGEGKRASWLTSYILACKEPDSGKFLSCGMMSTGLTEKEYEEMTRKIKPLIIERKGKTVFIKPKIVFEIGYEEIQKSPTYESGFALRFPRFIRDRSEDKSPDDADTIERVEHLFNSQGKAG